MWYVCVHDVYNGKLLSDKKEGNPAICIMLSERSQTKTNTPDVITHLKSLQDNSDTLPHCFLTKAL